MKSNWEIVKAEDFCFTVTDGTHDSPKAKENGHYLITSKHLAPYNIDFSTAKKISEEDYQKVIKRSPVEQWDILFSMIGTIGITYLEKNTDIYYACKNMGIFKFNGDKDKAYWLYYYLHTPQAKEYILGHLRGTTQQYLPLGSLRDFPIQVPAAEIRNNITSILRSLDDRIAVNTAINENLEQQAQAYFVDLFITNADPNWRIGTISDLGKVVGGGTPSKKVEEYYTSDGIAWITPKDLSNDKSKFVAHGETDITELGLAKSSATLMPKGTVLFSSRAPIGYIAIADGQVCTNQGFKSIVPFDNVGTAFVYYFLKENLSAIENVASGSTFKEVSGSTMKNFTVIIPDNDTLAEFQRFCSPLFEQQRALEYENRYLSSIRDTLLPKLMNGEIDVSEVRI